VTPATPEPTVPVVPVIPATPEPVVPVVPVIPATPETTVPVVPVTPEAPEPVVPVAPEIPTTHESAIPRTTVMYDNLPDYGVVTGTMEGGPDVGMILEDVHGVHKVTPVKKAKKKGTPGKAKLVIIISSIVLMAALAVALPILFLSGDEPTNVADTTDDKETAAIGLVVESYTDAYMNGDGEKGLSLSYVYGKEYVDGLKEENESEYEAKVEKFGFDGETKGYSAETPEKIAVKPEEFAKIEEENEKIRTKYATDSEKVVVETAYIVNWKISHEGDEVPSMSMIAYKNKADGQWYIIESETVGVYQPVDSDSKDDE